MAPDHDAPVTGEGAPDDADWARPRPTAAGLRRDLLGAGIYLVLALALMAATLSIGIRMDSDATWQPYVATAVMIAPLTLRRRFPIAMVLLGSVLFFALSFLSMDAYVSVPFQAAYFALLYSSVAWAPDRRLMRGALAVVLLGMAFWIIFNYATVRSFEQFFSADLDPAGPFNQLTASVVHDTLVNVAFFGGALAAGRTAWRSALRRAQLEEQSEKIRSQAAEIARRAVVDERLRIARELHDVVAHHVSVIGIQAGAARRLLGRDPDGAAQALRTVESSSREAVGEMRSLLGVLREDDDPQESGAPATPTRAPEPRLSDLDALVEEFASSGLEVELRFADDEPGDLADVPDPIALSLYRTVQEALTNVLRHSTASQVQVTVRSGRDPSAQGPVDQEPGGPGSGAAPSPGPCWIEAEIVDSGRPRAGETSGSGFGLRGIRERVALHGGEIEIGPRRTGAGWRVRARYRLRTATMPAADPLDALEGLT